MIAPGARRWSRRVSGFVLNLVLVVVTVAGAGYLMAGLLGLERYVITGGSMSGSFEKGSLAFEKHVPVSDLRVGDVITYLPPRDSGATDLVTHRIDSITVDEQQRQVLRTKGDANPDPDPWTFSLAGPTQPVLQFTVPWVGYALIALADRETRMLVIGIPAAVFALRALVELGQAIRPGLRGASRPKATVRMPSTGIER